MENNIIRPIVQDQDIFLQYSSGYKIIDLIKEHKDILLILSIVFIDNNLFLIISIIIYFMFEGGNYAGI